MERPRDAPWVTRLNDRRQFAVGLRYQPTAALVQTALERLLDLEPIEDPISAPLMRCYVIELAAGLQIAATCIPAATRPPLVALCDQLFANGCVTPGARAAAECVLRELRRRASPSSPALAHRVRARLDRCERRTRAIDLAREVGSNVRDTTRAFKHAWGMTPNRYHRDQLGSLAAMRAKAGDGVKQIAADLGCSQATVRRLVQQTTGVTVRRLRQQDPLLDGGRETATSNRM